MTWYLSGLVGLLLLIAGVFFALLAGWHVRKFLDAEEGERDQLSSVVIFTIGACALFTLFGAGLLFSA